MQQSALSKLSILSGSRAKPPDILYNQRWPTRFRRILQILYNTFQLATDRNTFLCVEGERVVAGLGCVKLTQTRSIKTIIDGACILPGASTRQLADSLQLLSLSPPVAYLADGDVLIVLGESSSGPTVVHITEDFELIERHIKGSALAHQMLHMHGAQRIAPRILWSHTHPIGHILAQERLCGLTVTPSDLDAKQLLQHFRAALTPLTYLTRSRNGTSPLPDGKLIDQSLASLSASSEALSLVTPFITPLKLWLSRQKSVAAIAHGDYWFQNILFDYSPLPYVSGLIDWERSREYATAGTDGMHLLMFAFSHWRGCQEPAVLAMIWSGIHEPTLQALITELAQHSGIPEDELGYLALQVWIMHLARNASLITHWSQKKRESWLHATSQAASRWISKSK